jgi:iron complex transport system substrate-binding protein
MRALLPLVLVGLLVGCGSSEEASQPASASITVEHKFGRTTVPSEPKRIVSVGLTEQDTILALGFKPIATTEWYGEQPYAVWPWAREALGDAKPVVLTAADGFAFEKIAALRPDVIIGTNSGMKQGDYEKLSAIAPTIAPVKGSTEYFSPWDQQVVQIATALGRVDEGRELVQDIRDGFAEAAEEHPEFAGKTATFSQNGFYDGLIYTYPADVNTEFLTYLGFEISPEVTALAKRPGEQVGISIERSMCSTPTSPCSPPRSRRTSRRSRRSRRSHG